LAFCNSLTNLTVDSLNSVFSSVGGVLFDKGQTTLIQCPGARTGTYTIPDSVTSIGLFAFQGCVLTNVVIPNTVTSIAYEAFYWCRQLSGVFFEGDAPGLGSSVFSGDTNTTVYYLPGTTGWGPDLGGRPTAPWYLPNPIILAFSSTFGVRTNRYGFTISWATNTSVVVDASRNLATAAWSPIATNTLTSGWSYFSDPQWTNYPARFYRIRSP
jgi:hypothetical protein